MYMSLYGKSYRKLKNIAIRGLFMERDMIVYI